MKHLLQHWKVQLVVMYALNQFIFCRHTCLLKAVPCMAYHIVIQVRASAGRLDTWLAQNPSDMLALIFCHNYYMKLGDSNLCKDLVGRLLPLMDPSSYDYAYSLSIMALGLVESGDLTEGEQWADRAIEAQPQNVYALHAKVNALELTGRSNEGESLMRQK
eukprot:55198_1